MTYLIAIPIAFCVALSMALALLIRRAAPDVGSLPLTAQWIDELSAEKYRPMMRLLSQEDCDFLRFQPGFTSSMAAQFRAERCQIFRDYLGLLNRDFRRIFMVLKVLTLHSRFDRPDLAPVLVRSQAVFACWMVGIECQLILYRWGVGSVDASSLVERFDAMGLELRTLVPSQSPVSA